MKSQEYQKLQHEFAPVYDTNSRILILGSFPSVKSREQQFFYGHPQNRFWKVIAALTNRPLPQTIEEKKRLLLENRIAVWDVIAECEIIGSSDSSIRNAVPNDLHQILDAAQIQHIYTNGGTKYYWTLDGDKTERNGNNPQMQRLRWIGCWRNGK